MDARVGKWCSRAQLRAPLRRELGQRNGEFWPELCLARAHRLNNSPHDSLMRTSRVAASTALSGPRRVASERRRRTHLRDLCDEVLASFRLASDRDPISEQDREAAMALLPRVAPCMPSIGHA